MKVKNKTKMVDEITTKVVGGQGIRVNSKKVVPIRKQLILGASYTAKSARQLGDNLIGNILFKIFICKLRNIINMLVFLLNLSKCL